MPGPAWKSRARWYAAAVILSVFALVFGVVSMIAPRVGYPLLFGFTMAGVLTYTMPLWDRGESRPRLVAANIGVLLTQVAILYTGMAQA